MSENITKTELYSSRFKRSIADDFTIIQQVNVIYLNHAFVYWNCL